MVSRILRKFNIVVYSYPHKTIRNISPRLKDSTDVINKRSIIYEIPCKDCSGEYNGERGRYFNNRLLEHKQDLKPINITKLKEND